MSKRKFLYHLESEHDDEIDQVLIVVAGDDAGDDDPTAEALAVAAKLVPDPVFVGRYNVGLTTDFALCTIAELRAFVG